MIYSVPGCSVPAARSTDMRAVCLDSIVEGCAHLARVAEVAHAALVHAVEERVDVLLGVIRQGVAVFRVFDHGAEDVGKLFACVVGEVDNLVKARCQARVTLHKLAHLLGVSCKNDHHLAAQVLRAGNDLVHSLLSCLVVFRGHERVGLVNEEHAAHGFIKLLVHNLGRVAHKVGDKILAARLYQLS